MPRHVAFLRGVSPQNLQMADLRACLEAAGFTAVRTIQSSGNVAFDCPDEAGAGLEQRIASALSRHVGRAFPVILRSAASLQALLRTDPYQGFGLPRQAKRIVSFLRETRPAKVSLPLTEGTATVIHQRGREVFSAYLPSPEGPVFMKLIQRAYGTEVTTRTWETVKKCATA